MDGSPNFAKSDRSPVVLLGLGFTTRRLARRLLVRGTPVFAISRNPELSRDLRAIGLSFGNCPKFSTIIHTIPPLPTPETTQLHDVISSIEPRRVIYISSTGVYGSQTAINVNTPVDPSTTKAARRIQEEHWVETGPWSSLVIRPAAIYGPGRGVHVRISQALPPRAFGPGMVSRIHVDDLATILDCAIESDLCGARPVADEHPCTSDEINQWCAELLRMQVRRSGEEGSVSQGRTVDGSEIRRELELSLAYPTYMSGILASLAEERCGLSSL